MIKKISLRKVASYGDDLAVLETDKRINLVYGLNGSGKTTFSNFLADKNHKDFSSCLIDGLTDEKILTYNHNFVHNNFYENNQLKGIFTLSSTNKVAEEKINNAEGEIKKIDLQLNDVENKTGLIIEQQDINSEIQTLRTNAEDKIWEIKTNYTGGDRILVFCLDDFNKKDKVAFFDKFLTIHKPDNKPGKTINGLKLEAEATQGADAKKYDEDEIKKIDFDFEKIENDTIFSEVIVGNENSTISALIKELNNADWVKQGAGYLKVPIEEKEKCPFCQQDTISVALHGQIKDYFDTTYQAKIDLLEELEKKYWSAYQDMPKEELFLANPFIKSKETDFKLLYNKLKSKISSNWLKAKDKKTTPSQIVEMQSSKSEMNEFNSFLDEVVGEIKSHNKKIENKVETKIEIVNNFWQNMRWEYDQTVENYISQKKSLDTKLYEIQKKIATIEAVKLSHKQLIEVAQKEIINIDEAIKNINTGLKNLGNDGFQINKVNDKFYQIKRDGKKEDQFNTLSEGEKTIISFLYFLELCKGREKEDEVVTSKIVVIDDPISSLSHIYIFNISQLIKYNFIDKPEFLQVFVLTHSLYFFHELLRHTKDKTRKLFRITKSSSNNSSFSEMKESEIQNDYQAYWQVLKDHECGKASDALLANSMRNILEHFFGFIEKEKFEETVGKIDQQKYQAFIRYINRESHSDFTNITDMKEIDCNLFKSAFKEIFEQSEYGKHYIKMMDISVQIP